ncbi:MAG: hypothetical protein AAB116_07245 [Candidatus Poribacteria bacterium]
MVNNGDITSGLLEIFKRDLGANVFVVGHRHYRSGDIHKEGEMIEDDINSQGRFVTISSSHENSRDAGHYMEYQYGHTRKNGEKESKEKRQGRAKACYAEFSEKKVDIIDKCNNIRYV